MWLLPSTATAVKPNSSVAVVLRWTLPYGSTPGTPDRRYTELVYRDPGGNHGTRGVRRVPPGPVHGSARVRRPHRWGCMLILSIAMHLLHRLLR